ncbi:uncharacterized protein KY384_009128 [Bacidia gigantensis]|uniref:uncharacterized protein n=1 Tax=Bacidia gigantensis TaxID=2732470 RepID=UPI001D047AD7|nr:uncharacterized protein KY384_009128 [Bacidia gigantensis]KAG8525484.1 hypothetical protein KY384_009128 [Bacidia gigantensis]
MAAAFRRHPRKIIAGGVGAVGVGYMFAGYLPNPMNSPAVSNIEGRYSSGGGSASGLAGTASKLGDRNQQTGNVEKSKGLGTANWDERIGDQKESTTGKTGGVSLISSCFYGGWILEDVDD